MWNVRVKWTHQVFLMFGGDIVIEDKTGFYVISIEKEVIKKNLKLFSRNPLRYSALDSTLAL